MSPNAVTFRLYAEGRTKRRAVGFILGSDFNAATFFDSLSGTAEREFRDRFEKWNDGLDYKKWFHGWDVEEFRECFEFKRQRERIFGFKCHPQPKSNNRLQMVVLAYYDDKEGESADKTMLRRINRARMDAAVAQAIKNFYPEYGA